ncbi:FliM/FliN family flagellar motor switch protein [Parvularcula oceani]|uniref:FliM/FliN family flagellar motor switch protein n=1 Tax=Parvularcula oceani TaxID=1247963 RepID=UPI0004E288AC|nr:FliM/FliN family flagellar motor C-terminal domain-containing protein [Parvularcula oceani]
MTEPHLRRLTRKTVTLPQAFLDNSRRWHEASQRMLPDLSRLLDADIAAETPLIDLIALPDMRAAAPEPGVLFAMTSPSGAGSWVRIGRSDALRLSALLLRASPGTEDPEAPALLDGLLLRPVIEAVLGQLYTAFEVHLALDEEKPLFDWPLGMEEEARPVLHVRLPFTAGEVSAAITVFVTRDTECFAAPTPVVTGAPGARRAASAAPVILAAVLDSWEVTAREVAAFTPGMVLPLPAASVDAVAVMVEGGETRRQIAEAELGKDRGRQALRLTRDPIFA